MTSFIQNIILAAVAFACLMAIIAMWTTDSKKVDKQDKQGNYDKSKKAVNKKVPNIILPTSQTNRHTRIAPQFVLDILCNGESKQFDLSALTSDVTVEQFIEGENNLKSIIIKDEFLSTPHLVIYQKNGEFKVSDCGSLNGTKIMDNGKLVKLANGHSLKDNDTIVLSDYTKIVVHDFAKQFYPQIPKQKIDVDKFKV